MDYEQAKDILRLWFKIGIGICLFLLILYFAKDCETNKNDGRIQWEKNDFDMDPSQRK